MKKTWAGLLVLIVVMATVVGRAESAAAVPGWTQNYELAKARAAKTGLPILALFTGSDWCPPCKQFDREVAHERAFLTHMKDRVVLLKLDYPQHMLQSPELAAQNQRLADRIGGSEFPRFYLLDADGAVLTKLDAAGQPKARTLIGHYIRTIQEGLDAVRQRKSA